jgi:hypothetical protein
MACWGKGTSPRIASWISPRSPSAALRLSAAMNSQISSRSVNASGWITNPLMNRGDFHSCGASAQSLCTVDARNPPALDIIVLAVRRLRSCNNSARYPAIASSTRSSGARPVVSASSRRRDSVSGLSFTTISVNLEMGIEPVKAISKTISRRLYPASRLSTFPPTLSSSLKT